MLGNLVKQFFGKKRVISNETSLDDQEQEILHARMMSSYLSAAEGDDDCHKSPHWDRFHSNFQELILNKSIWRNFRRTGLSSGFDDSLSSLEPDKLAEAGSFEEEREVQDQRLTQNLEGYYNKISALVGDEYLDKVYRADIGDPRHHTFNGRDLNYSDLDNTYFSWQQQRFLNKSNKKPRTILEIGAGYGGLQAQLKRLYPECICICIDLSEVNSVQMYYLQNSFPEANIFCYQDLKQKGIKDLFSGEYDFAILPAWAVAGIPDKSIDMVINHRSMMEMNWHTINNYFDHIHRITKIGGIFHCVNRFQKTSVGEDIRIKKYPFDEYWKILLSQSKVNQAHIQELLLLRTRSSQKFSVSFILNSLPPW